MQARYPQFRTINFREWGRVAATLIAVTGD
jgi:hypothetical protein